MTFPVPLPPKIIVDIMSMWSISLFLWYCPYMVGQYRGVCNTRAWGNEKKEEMQNYRIITENVQRI